MTFFEAALLIILIPIILLFTWLAFALFVQILRGVYEFCAGVCEEIFR